MFHSLLVCVLGEPNTYQNFGCFTRMWGFYLVGVWLWRISGSYSHEMMRLVLGGFYLEGSEYGFNCLRTDKQAVNIDGLFYITLTLSWNISSPHLWKLVSTNTGEISYPIHFLPLSKETLAVVPLPRKGSRIISPSFEVHFTFQGKD